MLSYVNAQNVVFPTKLTVIAAKQAVSRLAEAEQFAKSQCSDLHKLIMVGALDEARVRIEGLLSTPQFLFACTPRAARNLPATKRPLLESLFGITADILPLAGSKMVAKLKSQKKASGEHRPICVFDLRSRVRQEVVRRILTPYFVPRDWQYSHRGVPTAIKAIKHTQGVDGWWVAKLDIQKNFESFEFEKLSTELPLPSEVVEKVVIGRHMILKGRAGTIPPVLWMSISNAALRGIPQGSICSPVIANIIVAKLGLMKGNVRLFNYADDFLIFAPSEAALHKATDELIAAVAALPGGTFKLIPKQFGPLAGEYTENITFLGYRLFSSHGQIRADVSGKAAENHSMNINAFEDRLQGAYHGKMGVAEAVEIVAQFRAYTLAWCAAFSAAEDISEFEGQAQIAFDHYLSELGLDADVVSNVMSQLPPTKIEDVGSGV